MHAQELPNRCWCQKPILLRLGPKWSKRIQGHVLAKAVMEVCSDALSSYNAAASACQIAEPSPPRPARQTAIIPTIPRFAVLGNLPAVSSFRDLNAQLTIVHYTTAPSTASTKAVDMCGRKCKTAGACEHAEQR